MILVKNLSAGYNSSKVFSDVSFVVEAGDYVAIVGPNGSGKSTLIKAILGLLTPSEGTVSIFNTDSSQFQEWHKIGYIPQGLSFFNPFFPATVKEVVAMGLLSKKRFPKIISKQDAMAIDNVLSSMGIADLKNKPIGELSGGQQQRALIARALINKPELLILDEPAVALDPETRERFFDSLSALNKSKNVTIILITHDIGTVGRYASKLLYFDRAVVFYGTFKEFCESKNMGNYFGEVSQHIICQRGEECVYKR